MFRRDLLKGVVSGALLLCGKISLARASEDESVNAILKLFPKPASAAKIAQIYLHNNPDPEDLSMLIDRIFAGWDGGKYHSALSNRDTLKGILSTQCKQDFNAGRVSTVDGWVLSQTELRLYTVVHLAG